MLIAYYYFFNCNWVDTRWQQYSTHWVDTRWQQYSTHLHKNSKQNTVNGTYVHNTGARGGAVVEALSYKPEGRRIDSRWCQNFSLT
jgi:hypothetical protein